MASESPVDDKPSLTVASMDDDAKMLLYGTFNGDMKYVRPNRSTSLDELMGMIIGFREVSGLNQDQFATNMWGYPFIPYPRPSAEQPEIGINFVPKNISPSFASHPIFWIDMELTTMKDDETPEQWCVRMFFLLMSMRLWNLANDDIRWVDAPGARGIQATSRDLEQLMGDLPSAFDGVIYTIDDMIVPWEQYETTVARALETCESLSNQQVEISTVMLSQAQRDAEKLLGEGSIIEEIRDGFLDSLVEISKAIDDDRPYSNLTDGAFTGLSDTEDILSQIEWIISVLALPTIRAVSQDIEEYSQLVTVLAIHSGSAPEEFIDRATDLLGSIFSAAAEGAHFNKLITLVTNTLQDAERRLDLSYTNCMRVLNDQEPYLSYDGMMLDRTGTDISTIEEGAKGVESSGLLDMLRDHSDDVGE